MLLLKTLLLNAVGMATVYLGITFINGVLLPSLLSGVYALTSHLALRLIVAGVFLFAPGNYLVGLSYKLAGPAMAGSAMVLFSAIWMVVTAMILDGAKANLWILFGLALIAMGGLAVVHGIQRV